MTSHAPRAWIAAGTLIAAGVIAACGGDASPSADEAQVCGTLQEMVDHLVAERSQEAMDSLSKLQSAVEGTTNEQMAEAGSDFFRDALGVVDYSQLTIDQVRALALEYEASMAGSLGVIIDECEHVGAPVELQQGQ